MTTWCVVFGLLSIMILGYVYRAASVKDKNLGRVLVTMLLSQFDYGGDTLFVGYQSFVTPTLFVAALLVYILPLIVFVVTYRKFVASHLAHIYHRRRRVIVRFDRWYEKLHIQIGSFILFLGMGLGSTIVYMGLLFVFLSCKFMYVSFFTTKFVEAAGDECTKERFTRMVKHNLLIDLVFAIGALVIVVVDTILRFRQDFRSNPTISTWALLSIFGSSLVLLSELGPSNVTRLEYTPDDVLATGVVDLCFSASGLNHPSPSPSDKVPATVIDETNAAEIDDPTKDVWQHGNDHPSQ